MGARGPLPKDPAKRARRNKDVIATTELEFVKGEFGNLPEGVQWHPRTISWWETWKNSPLADQLTPQDIDYLIDTAFIHTQFWKKGTFALGAELRQRMAQFGATPADRARLRMTFVAEDEAMSRQQKTKSREAAKGEAGLAARRRYEGLRVVGS